MKKKATDSDALVPAVLTLPDNEVCHIHLPAGFISPVKNAAKKIVKAYDKVRNQPDVLSADQTPAEPIDSTPLPPPVDLLDDGADDETETTPKSA